jgi:heme exporter protein CcmD
MKFDLSDLHVVHVLAAYGVTAVLMLGLIISSLIDFMKRK